MSSEGTRGRTSRGWLAVALVLATVAATGPVTAVDADPTVTAGNASVERGQAVTVDVSLSDAPDGVAGFNVTVRLTDGAAATITDAELADGFGFGEAEVVAGGTAVRFKAADVNETVESGASDVALGSVTLRGDRDGEVDLAVSVDRLDDDEGERVHPATDSGRVEVIDRSDADDRDDADDRGDAESRDDTADKNGTADANGSDDPVDVDAVPDETDEAAVDGSNAEFDDTERLDRVSFEREVDGTVEVAEYDDVSESVEATITSSVTNESDADRADATVVSVLDVSPSSETATDANATLELTVATDDLTDPRSVTVVHGTDDGWERLPTTVQATDGGEVTLSARTDGFSLFAVVESESRDDQQGNTTDRQVTGPTTTAASTTAVTTTTRDAPAETTETATSTGSPESSDGGGLPGFTAGTAVVALVVALVVGRRRTT